MLQQPLPSTGASTGPARRRYRSSEYAEADKTLRLTMPEGLAVVRGILVVGPGAAASVRRSHRPTYPNMPDASACRP